MTSAADAMPGVAQPSRATWHAMLPRWRGLTREETLAAFVLAAALTALNMAMFTRQLNARVLFVNLPANFALILVACFTLLLGVVAADAIDHAMTRRVTLVLAVVVSGLVDSTLGGLTRLLGGSGRIGVLLVLLAFVVAHTVEGRRLRWAVVVLACGAAAAALMLEWRELLDDPEYATALDTAFRFARFDFYQWLLLAGAATFAYLDWRRTRAARARTHAAQVDRARTAKHALESRLQAMQARVEPQFLFNTLAQVRELYRVEQTRGERMLDELIAYLRAAMPKMRDTSSTIGQELELVRAYLAIASMRLGGRLAWAIEPPDTQVVRARIPPMMLLPLTEHVIAQVGSDAHAHLLMRAATVQSLVRIELSVDTRVLLPGYSGSALNAIRERLVALYGGKAVLEASATGRNRSTAVLTIPFELQDPLSGSGDEVAERRSDVEAFS
jgi:hypothetical protein